MTEKPPLSSELRGRLLSADLLGESPAWGEIRKAYDLERGLERERALKARAAAEEQRLSAKTPGRDEARQRRASRSRFLMALALVVAASLGCAGLGPLLEALKSIEERLFSEQVFENILFMLGALGVGVSLLLGLAHGSRDGEWAEGFKRAGSRAFWCVAVPSAVGYFAEESGENPFIVAAGLAYFALLVYGTARLARSINPRVERALERSRRREAEEIREQAAEIARRQLEAAGEPEDYQLLRRFIEKRLGSAVAGYVAGVQADLSGARKALAEIEAGIAEVVRLSDEPDAKRRQLESKAANARASLQKRIADGEVLMRDAHRIEAAVRERFATVERLQAEWNRKAAANAAEAKVHRAISAAGDAAVFLEDRQIELTHQLRAQIAALMDIFQDRSANLLSQAEIDALPRR